MAVVGTVPVNIIAGAAVMVTVNCNVALRAVGVPESVTVKVRLMAPACAATGAGPESRPPAVRDQPVGRVPPDKVQVYGAMPPVLANCSEYAAPTEPVNCVPLGAVIAGLAGIVSVKLPVLVLSATEVAEMITVCADVVAAGAIKVTEVVVIFDRVPPPLTLHVTPLVPLSLVTVAVSVIAFAPSTEVTEALTETTAEGLPPPHPRRNDERNDARIRMIASRENRL